MVEEIYTFHHLTFQEYLAAYHIASLSAEEQVQNISNHERSYNGDTPMNIKKFYCGLVKITEIEIIMNKKTFFFKVLDDGILFRMSMVNAIQCAFESQQIDFCNHVIGNGTVDLK